MIADLKPYPAMKNSGVEWLGKVPQHWEVRKLRQCGSVVGGMTPSMEASRYWNGAIAWVTPKDMKTPAIGDSLLKITSAAIEETSLRMIRPPAILMVVRGMILARKVPIAWTFEPVTINQDMKAINPTAGVNATFLSLLLDSAQDALQSLIDEAGHGTRRLPTERWRNLEVILPSGPEQAAIVRYLDHVGRRVRRFVRAKQKLIGLLEEQKQAIIHRAVTRGLDPDVPLKDSGVERLGKVPEHWNAVRLKSLVHRIDQGVSPQAENYLADDGSWGVLKAGCVNRGVFREREHKRLSSGFAIDRNLAVAIGDVLISRASGSPHLVGSVGRVHALNYRLILSDKTFRPRFRQGVDPKFMVRTMNSRNYRRQVEQAISGAQGLANNLPLSSLRSFVFAIPPIQEQSRIVEMLGEATAEIDTALDRAGREIKLLHEYRTRLFADVVTGKLDVGEAASLLPNEPAEAEPLDEGDAVTEPEDSPAADLDPIPAEADA